MSDDAQRCSVGTVEKLTVRVPEAARMLSISRAAIYRLLSRGEIEAIKSGQSTLIIVESVRAFVARSRVETRSTSAE